MVVLQATEGDEAEATAPVVPLLPVRGETERVTAQAFERRLRKLRSTHCLPKVKVGKQKA